MANNAAGKRPVDKLASKSYSQLQKMEIKTWKGVFIIALFAGIFGAFAFMANSDSEAFMSSYAKVSNSRPPATDLETGGRDADASKKRNITCKTEKDCSGLICPMVVGGDKPKCDLIDRKAGTCYCGGKCGDKYCDSVEKRDNTCPKDCNKDYSESFESGFGGWVPKHQIDCETDASRCIFNWSIKRSKQKAYDGVYSLAGYLDGNHDDGTIWVERPFEVAPNSRINCEISFYLWSENDSDSNQWPVLAYAGLKNPLKEKDFSIIGRTDEVAGQWKKYSYSAQLTSDASGKVWMAFGFGATSEFQRTYFLDKVSVSLETILDR
ncbi:MAG: hypothetical protein WCW77_03345 [Patescibacteria group bacterium]|jgi:hypothetical protein